MRALGGWLACALCAAPAGAQAIDTLPTVACTRVALGEWRPPLDWALAGHQDSVARSAGRVRALRDSVFAVGGGAGARDDMQWHRQDGERRLLLYPSWWPAGVLVRIDSAAGDTLLGEATALVADAGRGSSRTRARVVLRCRG